MSIFAFEVGTDVATGQADGGLEAGKYFEFGISPGYAGSKAAIAIPIKVGMSMGDYYEHPLTGEDEKFGYFSIAGIVTVPLGGTTKFGGWNVHFGAKDQKLGETTKFFNGDESSQLSARSGSDSPTEPPGGRAWRIGRVLAAGRRGLCGGAPARRARARHRRAATPTPAR